MPLTSLTQSGSHSVQILVNILSVLALLWQYFLPFFVPFFRRLVVNTFLYLFCLLVPQSTLSEKSSRSWTMLQGPSEGSSNLPNLRSYGYDAIRTLGKGKYGHVILANVLDRGDLQVAIKILKRGPALDSYKVYVAREIIHHASLSHPFVIQLYEVFLSEEYLCLVMELAASGDLFQLLQSRPGGRVSEDEGRYFFHQLAIGLEYIHGSGVANRDLKLENLLLTKTEESGSLVLKICDFGYSKHVFNSAPTSSVGTAGYSAPEIIIGGIAYDAKASDIWSVGVILYILVSGSYPFDVYSPTLAQDVVNGKCAPFDQSLQISEALKDLIGRMLQPSPNKRITLSEIFQHPWVLQGLTGDIARTNEHFWANNRPLGQDVQEKLATMLDFASRMRKEGEDAIEKELYCTFKSFE